MGQNLQHFVEALGNQIVGNKCRKTFGAVVSLLFSCGKNAEFAADHTGEVDLALIKMNCSKRDGKCPNESLSRVTIYCLLAKNQ